MPLSTCTGHGTACTAGQGRHRPEPAPRHCRTPPPAPAASGAGRGVTHESSSVVRVTHHETITLTPQQPVIRTVQHASLQRSSPRREERPDATQHIDYTVTDSWVAALGGNLVWCGVVNLGARSG